METTTEVLAIGAAACAIAALLVMARLDLLPGARPSPILERALQVLLGASSALLLVALQRGTDAEALGLTFLGIHAAARLGLATGQRGRVLLVLTALAFVAIAFGAADVTDALEDSPGWSDGAGGVLRIASDAVGITAFLTVAAAAIPVARERALPVAERLLRLASIAWLLIATAHLASLAGGSV
ncbi:MAG: hypothetical protein ACJ762_12055 [Solirubrobacteraceae bacterium]